jgi:hypothetical protein
VSRFHGIVIRMYFDEARHQGRAHFHAEYAGARASFDIETTKLIVGRLPRRVTRLVRRWARLYRDELRLNWERLRSSGRVLPIAPLP